jgi:hypothetical protein
MSTRRNNPDLQDQNLPDPNDVRLAAADCQALSPPSTPEPFDPSTSNLPSVRREWLDRPPGFSEDLWNELASLRTFLRVADRYVNAVSAFGGRSTGFVLLDEQQRAILNWLTVSPGHAVMQMHHWARDLAGNLRRDCPGIGLAECPPLPAVLPDGLATHVEFAVRDAIPALSDWLRRVETQVREFAERNRPPGDESPPPTEPVAPAISPTEANRSGTDGTGKKKDESKLSPAAVLAFRQARHAFENNPEWSERHSDQSVHEWLISNEEDLPADLKPVNRNFETWARYLRAARQLTGSQKNRPRHGRVSGSVVRSSEV